MDFFHAVYSISHIPPIAASRNQKGVRQELGVKEPLKIDSLRPLHPLCAPCS